MSFRCADCGKVKVAGKLVVRKTREKTYYEKQVIRGKEVEVPVGAGTEIVAEERVCTECAA